MSGKYKRYKPKKRILGLPWPSWIGIIIFIIGLLVVIFGSSLKVELVGSLCSIAALFFGIMYAILDQSSSLIQENIELTRVGFDRMDKHFEGIDKRLEAIQSALKDLPEKIAKAIK